MNSRIGVGDVVASGVGVYDGVGGRCEQRGRKLSILLFPALTLVVIPVCCGCCRPSDWLGSLRLDVLAPFCCMFHCCA